MHGSRQKELFNIKNDIGEKQNLIAQYPRKAKQLSKKLHHYLQKVKAQMPTDKQIGKVVPLP